MQLPIISWSSFVFNQKIGKKKYFHSSSKSQNMPFVYSLTRPLKLAENKYFKYVPHTSGRFFYSAIKITYYVQWTGITMYL